MSSICPYRIGHGYDVHRFGKGRKLFLGGVEIPNAEGLDGHSDADALLHAVCDAILGAVGAGDIGQYFPTSDNQWKDISSLVLLKKCVAIASEKGWRPVNVDTTIIAEKPKVGKYYPRMKAAIALCCALKPDNVGVKATTNEGLGAIGRGEGIAAFAVVLMEKNNY